MFTTKNYKDIKVGDICTADYTTKKWVVMAITKNTVTLSSYKDETPVFRFNMFLWDDCTIASSGWVVTNRNKILNTPEDDDV